jgi:pre-mRNA-splicing helicase BRR2
VERLSGEAAPDLKLLAPGRLVMATVEQWDMLSRRWRQRKAVQQVGAASSVIVRKLLLMLLL